MRLGPVFLVLLVGVWLVLGALAWMLAGLGARQSVRLSVLAAGLATGVVGALTPALVGDRGLRDLLLSFPLAFTTSFAVCLSARRWLPPPKKR